MEELNYMGGSFDFPDCEQYYNDLTAHSLHLAGCPTPLELPDVCSHCSPSILSNSFPPQASGLYGGEQQTAALLGKTYAQAAAWPSGYDEAWMQLVEPMPARRPRATSIAEMARMAMRSQPRQRSVQPARQRHLSSIEDAPLNTDYPGPVSRSQRQTYAEVAQQVDEQVSPPYNSGVSRGLFTSTENSGGLPNQTIYRATQQQPHRTIRTPMPQVAPYHVPQIRCPVQEVCIPTLTQPEYNLDPRNPYTLVQRTGRGGHRQPILSTLSTSGDTSPLSCSTVSTTSAASRARRRGNAMKDATLPHKCLECGNTYRLEDDLVRHKRRTHSSVQNRPHPCSEPDCHWRFVNPKDLKRHEKTHASDATPGFPCHHSYCIRSYSRADNLRRHIRKEHAEDSGLGTSRSSSEYAGMSQSTSSFPHV